MVYGINFYISSSLSLIQFMMMSCHINTFHITNCLWNIIFYSIPYIWKIHLPHGSQFVQVSVALTFLPSPNHFPPSSSPNLLPMFSCLHMTHTSWWSWEAERQQKYFMILTLHTGKWFVSTQKFICIACYFLMLWWQLKSFLVDNRNIFTGTRAPSKYKDRLSQVWRFPC